MASISLYTLSSTVTGMRNIDPGWHERFRQVLDASDYTQSSLAREMRRHVGEITRGTINGWYKGRIQRPSYENIVAACRLLRTDPDWLLYGGPERVHPPQDGQAKTARMVPIVGTAQLGPEGYWTEMGYPPGSGDEGLQALTDDPNAYALKMRGDSMEPAIREGWFVIVEPNGTPVPGEYVLVQTLDGQSMVKELLWIRGDTVALMSVNGNERLKYQKQELEQLSPVGPIFPPSSSRQIS